MNLSLQVIYPNQKANNVKNTVVYSSHASQKLKSMNNIQKLVTAAEVDPCMIVNYDRTLKKAKLPKVCQYVKNAQHINELEHHRLICLKEDS